MAQRLITRSLKGFTLLEFLFVITVIAVMAYTSINRYQHYREEIEMNAVKSDINIISQAVDIYFHVLSCDSQGVFRGELNPSISDLGLPDSYQSRNSLITQYAASIMNNGEQTADHKPIYSLQVNATLNSALSTQQLAWYRQALNAGEMDAITHRLSWTMLPGSSATGLEKSQGILDGARNVFREIENAKTKTAENNCAQ